MIYLEEVVENEKRADDVLSTLCEMISGLFVYRKHTVGNVCQYLIRLWEKRLMDNTSLYQPKCLIHECYAVEQKQDVVLLRLGSESS